MYAFNTSAVSNSKNNKNFDLNVTTSVRLDDIDCPNILLKEALAILIGYEVGDTERKTDSFSFTNGTDAGSSAVTPLSVIQPADSYIEKFNQSALLLNEVSLNKNSADISFEIKSETADLDQVTAAINPILKGQTDFDKSAISALAPNHSDFIDVGDILTTVVDMLGINKMMNSSEKSSVSMKAIGIAGGKCFIGNTEISAGIDENKLPNEILITAPVKLNADFKFMSITINATISITVMQRYSFSNQ